MRAIDLFCGAGGLSLGFKLAGHRIIYAVDNNKHAAETFTKNFPKVKVDCKDIREVDEFPECDVILGGYPCQGFSLAGNRKVDDPRNKLYLEFIRAVKQLHPKFFVAENVKGLLTIDEGELFKRKIKKFQRLNGGYNVYCKILNAKDYGAPQERQRVFIVGVRGDLDIEFEFPKPTHSPPRLCLKNPQLKRYRTLRDVLWDLPEPKAGEFYDGGYSYIYMSRNRKRGWDKQSFTIQANGRHVPLHPSSSDMVYVKKDVWKFKPGGHYRRLSVRECARIQTFPDSFVFTGPLMEKYKQIGNAVPPTLAMRIAEAIKDADTLTS